MGNIQNNYMLATFHINNPKGHKELASFVSVFRKHATEELRHLISEPVESTVNGFATVTISPSGSYSGRDINVMHEKMIKRFVKKTMAMNSKNLTIKELLVITIYDDCLMINNETENASTIISY